MADEVVAGIPARQEALFKKLDELGIKYETKKHKQCFTADDVERFDPCYSPKTSFIPRIPLLESWCVPARSQPP
eukprot:152883-Rhodomonas_salina.2